MHTGRIQEGGTPAYHLRDSVDFQLDPPKISSYQIIWGTPAYHFQGTVWIFN